MALSCSLPVTHGSAAFLAAALRCLTFLTIWPTELFGMLLNYRTAKVQHHELMGTIKRNNPKLHIM